MRIWTRLACAGVLATSLASRWAIGAPVTEAWSTTSAQDSYAVSAASLAGTVATASAVNDAVEVRDLTGTLLRSVTRAQITALCPWMTLDATNDGPAGLAVTDSGRLVFFGVTDTSVPGDGLGSDAILRLDVDTGQLTLFARLELGGPDTTRPRVALAHYKGRLYVGSTGAVVCYSATMNALSGAVLFSSSVSAGNHITALTVDRPQNGLIASTASSIHRATVSAASSLTFSLLGSISNVRAMAFSEHFGGAANAGLYVLESTTAPSLGRVWFVSAAQARGTGGFTPTQYLSIAENRHDLAPTCEGKLIEGKDSDALLIKDTTDTRLAYSAFLRNEFDQVVLFGRGLISPDGEPAGWVIDADVIPSWSRFHPASPDAACWTILLLLMSDEINRQGGGPGDPNAQSQVRAILQRYSGNMPDNRDPLRSADGIYWHWLDPLTGNAKSGWGDSYATMSTMKIVIAAARAAAYYPSDTLIRQYARDIICGVHNWDAYFNPSTLPQFQYQLYLLALGGGGPDPFTGSNAFNEGVLFADAASNYGGAYSDSSYAYWLNRSVLPSATLLTGRTVTGGVAGQFQAAFVSLYPLLLLQPYRAAVPWQSQIQNLRASNAAWTDDNGPQYNTVFSAGTTPSGYNADSLTNHPSNITTFTSLLAFAAGDGASVGRHVEAGGAYQAYRNGARETFKTGASILYRRSDTTRTYEPNSAGLPDVALGALGLAEILYPGSVQRVLTGAYPSCTLCPADLDNGTGSGTPDNGVDINDLLFFLARFEQGSLAADLDNGTGSGIPDGGVDISDLLFFLNHFEGGC